MKKVLLMIAVAFIAVISADAQYYVGGTSAINHDKDNDLTTFTIAPEVGYNINNQWAVGGEIGYTHQGSDGLKYNSFHFSPYARFTFYSNDIFRLFVDGAVGIATSKVKGFDAETGFQIGARPGIAIDITDHFAFVTTYGFLGYRDDYRGSSVSGLNFGTEDLNVGFYFKF